MAEYTLTRPMWTGDKTLYRAGTRSISDAHAKELGLLKSEDKAPDAGGGNGGGGTPGYPYAELLAAAKPTPFKTWDEVRSASDDDLLAVDGIGPSRLAEIRAYKG